MNIFRLIALVAGVLFLTAADDTSCLTQLILALVAIAALVLSGDLQTFASRRNHE
jgi:hypothetical protein